MCAAEVGGGGYVPRFEGFREPSTASGDQVQRRADLFPGLSSGIHSRSSQMQQAAHPPVTSVRTVAPMPRGMPPSYASHLAPHFSMIKERASTLSRIYEIPQEKAVRIVSEGIMYQSGKGGEVQNLVNSSVASGATSSRSEALPMAMMQVAEDLDLGDQLDAFKAIFEQGTDMHLERASQRASQASDQKSQLIEQVKVEHPGLSEAHISAILDHGKGVRDGAGLFKEKMNLVQSIGIRDQSATGVAYGATIQQIMQDTGIDSEETIKSILNHGATLRDASSHIDHPAIYIKLEAVRDKTEELASSSFSHLSKEQVGSVLSEGAMIASDQGLFGANLQEKHPDGTSLTYQEAFDRTVEQLQQEIPFATTDEIVALLNQGKEAGGLPTLPGLPEGMDISELAPKIDELKEKIATLRESPRFSSLSKEQIGHIVIQGYLATQKKGEYQKAKEGALASGINLADNPTYPFHIAFGNIAMHLGIETRGSREPLDLITDAFNAGRSLGPPIPIAGMERRSPAVPAEELEDTGDVLPQAAAHEPLFTGFGDVLAPIQEKIDDNKQAVAAELADAGIVRGDVSSRAKELVSLGALAAIGKGPLAEGPRKGENLRLLLEKLQAEDPKWTLGDIQYALSFGGALKADLDASVLYQKNSKMMKEEVSEFLTSVGLEFQEVQGDGNCFFRAVAVAEGKSQEDHAEYRRQAAEHLEREGSPVAARAGRNMEYAQKEEVEALSKTLGRPIVVVMWRGGLDEEVPARTERTKLTSIRKIGFEDAERDKEPIVVTLAGNHYNVVPTEGRDLSALLALGSI